MKRLFLLVSLVVSAAACNDVASVTKKQSDALTAVTNATCDRYNACGDIGPGKTYTDSNDCQTQVKAFWNNQWPVAQCDGHINGDQLTVCTDAVSSTDCSNFIDQLNTVYDKCAESDVCSS